LSVIDPSRYPKNIVIPVPTTMSQLQASPIFSKYESNIRNNTQRVLTIIAIILPQPPFLFVSNPNRNTPKVAPPVRENILYANHKIFVAETHIRAIAVKSKREILLHNSYKLI
jgi:hypothetical protein